ncbi:lytic transglycosylase domain-containing protein [Sphingobium sp. LSP13-1-1.1]|uniref:lytic transglycosylase domain-containing protein n=1 Tax=unclassified Sphingobium TaxID=2611147 RepID=UPI00341C85DD
MSVFADIAGTGAATTGNRVTNAIAMASRRTGVDFAYLLGQAKIESSLNPTARATTSSATGLYQFVDQSWLAVIDQHGSEYGLGWAADAISRGSNGRYYVADPDLRQQILDLRKHPETASVMAAEHAADNKATLEQRLGREAEPVDLYMAHFLGVGGASRFLSMNDRAPNAAAAAMFPAAARANRSIFYDKQGNARSFAEIRDRFAAKLQKGFDSVGGGAIQYADASLPSGAKAVQPADYVRIETQRLASAADVTGIRPQPQTARLAYLMLATLGR